MTVQRADSWLKAATPDQITTAVAAGELDDILGVVRNEAGNTAEDLRSISRQ